jgi:ABC-type amino acid transport system permease subunit
MHLYFAVMYAFVSLLCLYALYESYSKGWGELIKMLFVCGIFIAWTFAHYKTSDAVETGKKWASTASYILAIPLLIGFPIGTFFGVRMMSHASKLKQE